MTVARRFYVSGRVQGVWFRAGTRGKAGELGVSGWAVNLPDGRVEVLAVGESKAVAGLQEWLCEGPPLAEVTGVEEGVADPSEVAAGSGFRCG